MEEKKKLLECQSFFEPNFSSLVIAPKADTFDNEVLREKCYTVKWKYEQFSEITILVAFEFASRAWNFSNQTSRLLLKLSKNVQI